MKKFVKFLFISVIVVTTAFGVFKIKNKHYLDILNKNIEWSITLKGFEGAKSFDFDEKGNVYIAFEDRIRVLNKNGNDELVIKEKQFNILDILYYKNNLYIATDNRILEYDLSTKVYKEVVSKIPNNGINKKVGLLLDGDKLYFSVGSNTNSGVVSSKGEAHDVATGQWILNGNNYGEAKTGGFTDYSVSTENNEKVESQKVGSAAILTYDIKSGDINLFSHGIRNIKGWDIDKDKKIKAIVGGMQDTNPRNIKDDKDYIYNLEKDVWYGWPDYSGGDPITSPRFTNSEKHEFLIKNHIDKNPSAPIYQDKDVSSLEGLAIDREGKCFESGTLVFGNNKENYIYVLNKKGVARKLVSLGNKSKVEKILFNNESFYILDSKAGCLYNLKYTRDINIVELPKVFWIFLIVFILVIVIVLLTKNMSLKNKKGL